MMTSPSPTPRQPWHAARGWRAPRLGSDQRGAILVLGLVLGAFMVGLLFHVVGVAHALMWREVAQDAADHTAYESAVWNARGMNVVVALNIFMAIVMAVLIAWRMIMVFLAALLILITVLQAFSYLPSLAFLKPIVLLKQPTTVALRTMAKHDTKLAGRVYQVIMMLHQGQKVVASATPVISVARSFLTTKDRYDVNFAAGVGFHLFPTRSLSLKPRKNKDKDRPCPKDTCCKPTADPSKKPPRKKTFTVKDHSGLLGAPFSLPVMGLNDVKILCAMGSQMYLLFVDELFEYMGNKIGGPPGLVLKGVTQDGSPLKLAFGILGGALSGFFCEDLKGALKNLAGDQAGCGTDASCRADVDASAGDPSADTGYSAKNVGEPETHKGRIISSDDLRWSLVWPLAINGSLFTQHWGIVRAERTNQDHLNNLLKVADAFNTSGATPHSVGKTATLLAQAEMFYDCEGPWLECYLTCSWTINWRARLRRVHDPLEMASGLIEEQLVDNLWDIIGNPLIVQHVPGINVINDYIKGLNWRLVPQFPGDGTYILRSKMANATNAGGSNAAQRSIELAPGNTSQMVH